MAKDYTPRILEAALWRCTLNGLEATSTEEIARHAYVGKGTLFRAFASKDLLLDAAYAHAVAQLQAPLLAGGAGAPRPHEFLHELLARWWHLPARVARDQPHVFDYWRLYRTLPQPLAPPTPLLGPFEPVLGLVARALADHAWVSQDPIPLPLVGASMAGQWTAAVELVLREPTCQADPALTARVLTQAYQGWWQGLGLSNTLPVERLPY